MLRTPLCDLLGIEAPVVCAPFGPREEVDLAVAVCAAGGLGSLGTGLRSTGELRAQWERVRALTARPFAINHTVRPFDAAAFEATLAFRPAAISFHLVVPADLIARARDAGILWIQQVMDRAQAREAVAAGAEPRSLRTPLVDRLRENPGSVDPATTGSLLRDAVLAGRGHEHLPFAGQSVGLIDELLEAGEIVRRTVAEAEAAQAAAAGAR